jgi:hypothetical protein
LVDLIDLIKSYSVFSSSVLAAMPGQEDLADSRHVTRPFVSVAPHFASLDVNKTSRPLHPPFFPKPHHTLAWYAIVWPGCLLMNLLYLGSERLCLVFRRPPTYCLHPMHDFVYAFSILSCPRIRVCSMNLMALMASLRVFRIARRLFRPGNRPSSCLRRSRRFLQSSRM